MIIRMLELTVRVALAPIPLSFSARNGFGQETVRYFRSVLACALEPLLMLIGVACTGTIAEVVAKIVGNNTGDLITGTIAVSMSYLILAAYLAKTKELSKDIIAR